MMFYISRACICYIYRLHKIFKMIFNINLHNIKKKSINFNKIHNKYIYNNKLYNK